MEKFLTKLAKEAGKLLLENFESGKGRMVRLRKSEHDYRIQADELSERFILERIKEEGIACRVIAEESGTWNFGDERKLLLVDPLDGSVNYSFGIPLFCVALAYYEDGLPKVGVVYDPWRKELFRASCGKGSFLNGKKIAVDKKVERLGKALCVAGFSYKDFELSSKMYVAMRKRCMGVRVLGSAELTLAWLAAGRLHCYVDLKQSPWDVAAGAMLVRESGGRVTDFKGEEWKLGHSEVLATNGLLHKEMLTSIRRVGWKR